MRITIERAQLLRSLAHVTSVVERRATIPILSNILLRGDGEGVTLTATDMDIDVVETVPALVEGSGAITAPAHTLHDIVRKLPDGAEVTLDATGDADRISLRAGRSKFSLPALPADDFPALSQDEAPHRFSLKPAQLKRAIGRTSFAVSTEETRYYLNGVYLHPVRRPDGVILRAVATDGHRLAQMEQPCPEGAETAPGVIIPRKTVAEVSKLLNESSDADVRISLSDTRVSFDFGGVVLSSKLIDGSFPDYERVIPIHNDKDMEVDGAAFAKAVDRVATISTEKSRAVKLALEPGKLTLSAHSPDAGAAIEEIEADYAGPAMEIGFNSKYLLDIMRQIKDSRAVFRLADGVSPAIVRDVADDSALYVLMPMRIEIGGEA